MRFLDTMLSRVTSDREFAGAEAVPGLEMLQNVVNNLKRIEETVSVDQVAADHPTVLEGHGSPKQLISNHRTIHAALLGWLFHCT